MCWFTALKSVKANIVEIQFDSMSHFLCKLSFLSGCILKYEGSDRGLPKRAVVVSNKEIKYAHILNM